MTQEAIDNYNLGYCYYTGTGGYPFNYAKAMEYFKKSASLGCAEAMNYVGLMYQNGYSVMVDKRIAAQCYMDALRHESQNSNAAYNLGFLYYDGAGVAKNLERAFGYFNMIVNKGRVQGNEIYPNGAYMLGVIYLEYYKDYAKAYPLFGEAAKYGNVPGAWHSLGWLTLQGASPLRFSPGDSSRTRQGVMDLTAMKFFKNGALAGYAPSMDEYGRLLVKTSGQLTPEAEHWIRKAASSGYEPARKRLKLLNYSKGGSFFDLFTK